MCRICGTPTHTGFRAEAVEQPTFNVIGLAAQLRVDIKANGDKGQTLADEICEGARLIEVGEVDAGKAKIVPSVSALKTMIETRQLKGAKLDAIMRSLQVIKVVMGVK